MYHSLRYFLGMMITIFTSIAATAAWDDDKGCLSCHGGIENISDNPVMSTLSCTVCHKGDGAATEEQQAHKDMFANPSDLRVVDQTCGMCHAQEIKDTKTSLHATSAGVIASTRYAAGLQGRTAKFGNYPVEAQNKGDGKKTVDSLAQVPSYDPSKPNAPENHMADDYLRNQCLRCHIWSKGHERDGDYRGSGCAACHVEYSNAGTYEGGDKSIDQTQKGRPRIHKISKKITVDQCQHCHNRGARTGVSYMGLMEADGYGTPFTEDGEKQSKLHGKFYNHLQADLHYDAGLACIDCHVKEEIHGDGSLYTRKEYAVGIRCETCHGNGETAASLQTDHGVKLNNVKREGDVVTLTRKLDGEKLTIPQISFDLVKGNPKAKTAMMDIPEHLQKLECYACHARWAPQCYGCHAKQDVSKPSGDWLVPSEEAKTGDPSLMSKKGNRENSSYSWSESRSYVRWEDPVLGINEHGKVSPFIPGCQVIFTQVGGENDIHNVVETTKDGTSGLMHNPVQPHTLSKQARECADCHMSQKALGLGSGIYDIQKNFPNGEAPVDFELERIVDQQGNQLQGTAIEGARPFNKEEMDNISRIGACIACHKEEGAAHLLNKGAPTDEIHTKAIEKLTK